MAIYFRAYAALAQRIDLARKLRPGTTLGHSDKQIADVDRRAIALLDEIRNEFKGTLKKVVISECVGPHCSCQSDQI